MTETRDKFMMLVEQVKTSYKNKDVWEVIAGVDLLELENMYKNFATKGSIESQYPTFKSFLHEELGRSYAQVKRSLEVARWIKKYDVELFKIGNIPITALEIVARSDIKPTEEVIDFLLNNTYLVIKDEYDTNR